MYIYLGFRLPKVSHCNTIAFNTYLYFTILNCILVSLKTNIMNIIYLIRTSLGYSQEYVASKLNITQQNYSRLEKNPESFNIKKLIKLAEIFNVDISSLLPSNNTVNRSTKQPMDKILPEIYLQKERYESQIQNLTEEIRFLRDLVRSYTELDK